MNKFALSSIALAAVMLPSIAFAGEVTYWNPSAGDGGGSFSSYQTGGDAAAQAVAAQADANRYTSVVSLYDPSSKDQSSAFVTVKTGADTALIGTHDAQFTGGHTMTFWNPSAKDGGGAFETVRVGN